MEDIKNTITKEQLLAATNIKSVAEAKKYLNTINGLIFLLLILTVLVIFLRATDNPFEFLVFILYVLLMVYFYSYCRKIIKLTKVDIKNPALAALAVYEDVGIFYFYPKVTLPLKIITGKADFPRISSSPEEKKALIKEGNRLFWRTLKPLIIIFSIIIIIYISLVIFGVIN